MSTAVTTNSSGNVVATIADSPFGATRTSSGTLNTDERFTGAALTVEGRVGIIPNVAVSRRNQPLIPSRFRETPAGTAGAIVGNGGES